MQTTSDKINKIDEYLAGATRDTIGKAASDCGDYITDNVFDPEEKKVLLQHIYDAHPACPFTWLYDTSAGDRGPMDVTVIAKDYASIAVTAEIASVAWPCQKDGVTAWYDVCPVEDVARFALWTLYGCVELELGGYHMLSFSNWRMRAAIKPDGWGVFSVNELIVDMGMHCAHGRPMYGCKLWMDPMFSLMPEPGRTFMFASRITEAMHDRSMLGKLLGGKSMRYEGTSNYWGIVWPIISAATDQGVTPSDLVITESPLDGSNRSWTREEDVEFAAPSIITDDWYWLLHPRAIQSMVSIERDILYGELPKSCIEYHDSKHAATPTEWISWLALKTAIFGK